MTRPCYHPAMPRPDLNLLVTLDVLLAEGSVARAARRLRLSPSAMSRALARLRTTTGDPLLVRAGRGLVPTPRALELRERVGHLVQEAEAVLRPAEQLHLNVLVRTFTLRTSEGFVENFGRPSLPVSAWRRPASGCVSYRSRIKTVLPYAPEPSIWKPALLSRRRLRSFVCRPCSTTGSSASSEWGTR